MPGSAPASGRIRIVWQGLGVAGTALAVALQLRLQGRAGGLWRDEVNTLNTATAPGLADLWRGLEYESAPVLWPLLLRGWSGLGFESDVELRVLGLLGALSLLGAAWWVTRRLGLAAPLLLVALVALNPELLRWSASLRAFGLGAALVLLVFEAMLGVVRAPTRGRALWALLVTLLAVHALYYDAVLVLAICVGAAALALYRGTPERILLVGAIGALAALSMLPYVPILREQYLGAEGFLVERLWWKLDGALASQHALAPGVWGLLVLGALVLLPPGWSRAGAERELALYAAVTGLALAVCFGAFLVGLGYATQSWYYLGFLALCAVVLEALLAPQTTGTWGAGVVLAMVSLLLVLAWPALWRESERRFTDVDLLAAEVGRMASPDDFVLVQPWFLAISYDRYHAAAAPWSQLPPLQDPSVHRWDLLSAQIARKDPIAPVLQRAGETLRRGGRVFVVRLFPPLPPGAPPRQMPPDPEGVRRATLYDTAWSTQLDHLLRAHASRILRVPPKDDQPVSVFENAWLQVAYGKPE